MGERMRLARVRAGSRGRSTDSRSRKKSRAWKSVAAEIEIARPSRSRMINNGKGRTKGGGGPRGSRSMHHPQLFAFNLSGEGGPRGPRGPHVGEGVEGLGPGPREGVPANWDIYNARRCRRAPSHTGSRGPRRCAWVPAREDRLPAAPRGSGSGPYLLF